MRSFPKWAWVCLMAFSLILYGCGGGGGGSSDPVDPGPTTHDVNMGGLLAGYTTVAAGTYNINAGASMDVGHATFTCPSGGDNCQVVVKDDGTVTSTGGAATAMPSKMAKDAKAAADAAVAKAAKDEAMRVEAMIKSGATLADNDTTAEGNQPIVSIVESTVNQYQKGTVTFTGQTATTDPKFAKTGDPASIAGWDGGIHTRTNDDTKHTVVMYSNEEADKDAKYGTYFSTGTARPGVTGDHADGVLTLETGTNTGDHELFSIKFGITAAHQTLPIVHDDPDTNAVETKSEYKGMFSGVAGTFTCTATCSVSSDEDANLSQLAGTWTFTPDGIVANDGTNLTGDDLTAALTKIMVPGVVPDQDFMIFGYWEQAVTDDGTTTYSMLPIADGKRDYQDDMTGITGKATYSGPATGLYMMKTLTPEGQPTDPYTSGQFTADAMLTASFGGGTVAANDQFSISGTISNFMNGGKAINSAWVVNLNRRMIGADNDQPQRNIGAGDATSHGAGSANSFSGVTDGGALGTGMGSWSGLFHGADDATTTSVVEQPASLSGMFDAHFSNGHVRGAFAASK